jgi:hypothetical protein
MSGSETMRCAAKVDTSLDSHKIPPLLRNRARGRYPTKLSLDRVADLVAYLEAA